LTENSEILKRLDEHGAALTQIQRTLNILAVQDEQISQIQEQIIEIFEKYDELANPKDGAIYTIRQFQASCPRAQFKWIWMAIVPIALTQLSMCIVILNYLNRG